MSDETHETTGTPKDQIDAAGDPNNWDTTESGLSMTGEEADAAAREQLGDDVFDLDVTIGKLAGDKSEKDTTSDRAEDVPGVGDEAKPDEDGEEEPADDADDTKDEPADDEETAGDDEKPDGKADVPDKLTQRAKALGLSEDDIAAFDTPEDADIYLSRMEAAVGKILGQQGTTSTDAARTDTPSGEEAEAKPGERPKPDTNRRFELSLNEDEFDADLVGQLHGLNDYYAERAEQTEQAILEVHEQMQEAVTHLYQMTVDNFVSSLGDEWAEVFGKGPTAHLEPGSKEYQARAKLWKGARDAWRGESATNGKKTPFNPIKHLDRARLLEFGRDLEKFATKKVANKVSKRKGQTVSRPRGRGAMTKAGTSLNEELNSILGDIRGEL
jgi:hypothetical protein